MPKIADIIKDSNLTGTDCVIGTEALTNRTISIPLDALSTFIGDSGDLLSQSGIQVAITDNEAFRESIDIRALTGAEYDALVLVGTDIDGGVQSDTLYNVTDEATDVSITQEGIQLSITDNEAFRASIGAVSPIIGFTESNEPSLTNNVPKWSSTNQLTWSPDILGGDGGGGSTTIGLVQGLVAALDAKVDDTQVLTDVPLNAVFTDTDNNDNTQLTNTTILPVLNASTGSIAESLLGNAPNTQRTDTEINNLVTTRVNTTFVNNLVGVDADLINGNTVGVNVPSDAVFTDTTYDTTNFLAANTVLGPLAGFSQVNTPTVGNSVPKFSAAGQITWSPDLSVEGEALNTEDFLVQPTDTSTLSYTSGQLIFGTRADILNNLYRTVGSGSITSTSGLGGANFVLIATLGSGMGTDFTLTQAGIETAITDDTAFRESISIVTLTEGEYEALVAVGTDIVGGVQSDALYNTTGDASVVSQDLIESAIVDDPSFRTSIGIVTLTNTQYTALTPDADTIYNITDDETGLSQSALESAITDNAAFRTAIGVTGADVLTQDTIEAAITDDGGFLESIGAGVPVTQLILENTITNDANFRAAIGAGVPLTQTTINAAITDETAFRTSIGAGLPITQARVETSITDNDAFRTSIGVADSVLSSLTAINGLASSATLAVNTAYFFLGATSQNATYTFPDGVTAGDRIKSDQLFGNNGFEVTITGKLNNSVVVTHVLPMNSDYYLEAEWTGVQWVTNLTASLLAGRVAAGLYADIPIVPAGGIVFNSTPGTGTTIDSNKLDDYEEGTWTPNLRRATAFTSTFTDSIYTKTGNVVKCSTELSISGSTDQNTWALQGLPFSDAEHRGSLLGTAIGLDGGATTFDTIFRFSSTNIGLRLISEADGDSTTYATHGGSFRIQIEYITNA